MIALVRGSDRRLELIDVHAEGIVAIDEHNFGADLVHRTDGGVESIGGRNHLVAGLDADCFKRNLECVGTGANADRVFDADSRGEELLEFGYDLSKREVAAFDQCAQFIEYFVDFCELLREW